VSTYNFEVYDRRNSPSPKRRRLGETVTVQRAGVISFSTASMAALGNPRAVVYLVDREDRVLGFRAAPPGTPNASLIGGTGHTASGVAVLKYMEADLSESRRYPLVVMDGVYCIDLKQPGEVVANGGSTRQGRSPR
jgi:hypothetical protein